MSTIGQIEKRTQNRVVALFRDRLGYDYLGNWIDRPRAIRGQARNKNQGFRFQR